MVGVQAFLRWVGRSCRRVAVTLGGVILIAAGLVGLAMPIIPGWLGIIAGLSVLSTEYAWAHHLLQGAKRQATRTRDRVKAGRRRRLDRAANPEHRPSGAHPANTHPEEGPRYRRTG